jgi:hypothetical protein
MADTDAIDLDTGAVVEKRGRGRPRGSKNKPKDASMVVSSSSAPVKQRPDCPLGSKNKPKHSASLWMQMLHATVLLLFLLSMCSLFSLLLALNAVSSSVCL